MENQQIINKARRTLNLLIGNQRLYGQEYQFACVQRVITGSRVLYVVTESDFVVTFEDVSRPLKKRHNFISIEPVKPITHRDTAIEFLQDMLSGKGWKAVANQRYGANADAVIKAAQQLLEGLK